MSWTETDPGQGDPEGVVVLASSLQADADDAASASRMLRSVQDQTSDAIWRGTSANAFRHRVDKIPGHLDKLQASYSDAAADLRAYAASVRQIADDAVAQHRAIAHAQADADTAIARQAAWIPPLDPVTGHPDPTATNPHDATVTVANASAHKAQSRLHDLAGRREAADGRIIGSLKRAHREGMRNKHWWQKALDVVSDVLSKITIVLMVVALVAIVVLAIVQPELIPGLLLLAGQAMAALSAAQLATDGARKAIGDNVSWGTLGMDAVGLLPAVGKLGKVAEGLPGLGHGIEMLRGGADIVRAYDTAGSAFIRSIATDLKATRYFVRVADTGVGTSFMAGIERQGKMAGRMLTDAKQSARTARSNDIQGPGFTIVDGGTGTRQVNFRPHAADPNWGLTRTHLNKHLFGSGQYSLSQIDPAGNVEIWTAYVQDLAAQAPANILKDGVIEVMGSFPRTNGAGTFQLGLRIAPNANGSFDLVTLLTRQVVK